MSKLPLTKQIPHSRSLQRKPSVIFCHPELSCCHPERSEGSVFLYQEKEREGSRFVGFTSQHFILARLRPRRQGLFVGSFRIYGLPLQRVQISHRLCPAPYHPERSLAESKDLGPAQPGHACPEHSRRGSADASRCSA